MCLPPKTHDPASCTPNPVSTLVICPPKSLNACPWYPETRGNPRRPRMQQVHMLQVCTVHAPGSCSSRQSPACRLRRSPGWRVHGSVEDTKLSTNKQHSLSCPKTLFSAHWQPNVRDPCNEAAAHGMGSGGLAVDTVSPGFLEADRHGERFFRTWTLKAQSSLSPSSTYYGVCNKPQTKRACVCLLLDREW